MKITIELLRNLFAGLIICLLAGRAMCQTTTLLYSFAGSPDAANPYGELVLDSQGNLYGGTVDGGFFGYVLNGDGVELLHLHELDESLL